MMPGCAPRRKGRPDLQWKMGYRVMEISPTAPPEPLPRIGDLRRYFADRPELGVAAVYMFGSHAAGRAHRESDVDLGVLLRGEAHPQRDDRFEVKLRLIGELGGVVAPAAADVVILNDAPPLLGRHVVNAGTCIYLGDAAADHAYVRDVQLRAADLEPWLRRMRQLKLDWLAGRPAAMSPVVERLVELRRHLDHLRDLALDLDRAIAALDRLDAIARFAAAVRDIEADSTA
jgi:predicted nucleotidyltransferase